MILCARHYDDKAFEVTITNTGYGLKITVEYEGLTGCSVVSYTEMGASKSNSLIENTISRLIERFNSYG